MTDFSKYVVAFDVLYVYNEGLTGRDVLALLSEFISNFPGDPKIDWSMNRMVYEQSEDDFQLYYEPSSSSWIINATDQNSGSAGSVEDYYFRCKQRYNEESKLFIQICTIANNLTNSFDRYYFINRFYFNKSATDIIKILKCSKNKVYYSEKRIEEHFLKYAKSYKKAYARIMDIKSQKRR